MKLNLLLAFALSIAPLRADLTTNVPVMLSTGQFGIGSISVQGTNLVLSAGVPAGLKQVTLEMCPALDAAWEERGILDVQAGVGEVTFTIPKPTNAVALFRLKGLSRSETGALVSTEARYVTMPSLGPSSADAGAAVFHFKGRVDGSDRIVITREGALWSHLNWHWPLQAVTINGAQWNPKEKNYVTTEGTSKFLPEAFSLESADLDILQGRDVVALERATNALIVHLDDTPAGASEYEFRIRFHPVTPNPASATYGTPARLKIAARIDGSDRIKIDSTQASWEHKAWSSPTGVRLNNIPWSPSQASILKNEGTNTFLPPGIDFSTARIVSRKGRDLATMWADKDAVWIWFADNPNGNDVYELEISFGQ